MTIVDFWNGEETPLTLVVEPWGERHEVPHLARAGLRYTVIEGAEDRSFSAVSRKEIEFWCNADSYEIDIVLPTPGERLTWDICVNGGWCGGIVEGQPVSVRDLLPASGNVMAEEFARLAVQADDGAEGEPPPEHLRWLEAKFVEHLGAQSVPVEELQRVSRRTFDAEGG